MNNEAGYKKLKEVGKILEKAIAERFCEGEKPGVGICFTLPPNFKTVTFVTNLSRSDGVRLFQGTANKMIAKTN